MVRRKAVAGAIALSVFALPPGPAGAAAPASCAGANAIATDGASSARASSAVRCLVNAERAARRIQQLRASTLLGRAAARHSGDMVRNQFFGHVSPSGGSLRRRVLSTGYLRGGCLLGETLAWGTETYATPTQLVATMMASPSHRRILLDRRFRDVGVGLVTAAPVRGAGGRGVTLTLNLGRR